MPAWIWLVLAVPAVYCQTYPGIDGNPLTCPSGTYYGREGGSPFFRCAACIATTRPSDCASGTYLRPCGGESDAKCVFCPTCGPGTYVSTACQGAQPTVCSACLSCVAGTYMSQSCGYLQQAVCSACTVCYPGTYQYSDCQDGGVATRNRVCMQCNNDQWSRAINSLSCDSCRVGYYRIGGLCSSCATRAEYVTDCASRASYVQCDGVNLYQCVPCTGSGSNGKATCGPGLEASKTCTTVLLDGSAGQDAVCKPCDPGFSNLYGYQFCSACPVGYYSALSGATACTACSNKPAQNTSYLPWGSTVASSATCPWGCNSGFYKTSAGGCALCSSLRVAFSAYTWIGWPAPTTLSVCQLVCSAGFWPIYGLIPPDGACGPCEAGKFKPFPGNGPCTSCTNAQSITNAYYLEPEYPVLRADACPWDCRNGYVRVGSSCVMCGAGKYKQTMRAYEWMPPINCTVCTNCSALGKYQTRQCFEALDTQCADCRQACAVGEYKSAPCLGTRDLQCAACVPACPLDFYRGATDPCPGTTTFDTVRAGCLPCTNASLCPVGMIIKRRCNGSDVANPQCEACTRVPGGCPRDQYMFGCSLFQDYACRPFTSCPPGQYLANSSGTRDGVCAPCSPTCESRGLQTVAACSTYSDALCGGQLCRVGVPCLPPPSGGAIYCRYHNDTAGICTFCPVRWPPPLALVFHWHALIPTSRAQEGYSTDGLECYPCPRGATCDRRGAVAALGECPPGYLPDCTSVYGYVQCNARCDYPPLPQIATTGSFCRSNGTCAPYFSCASGYYQAFTSAGQTLCLPCASVLPPYAGWVTPGLAFNDGQGCLWECDRAYARVNGSACSLIVSGPLVRPTNKPGFYGVVAQTSCPRETTSEAGAARTVADCMRCPPLPALGYPLDGPLCAWACATGSAIGASCVPPLDCNAPGVDGSVSPCVSRALPWQPAGLERTGLQSSNWTAVPAPPSVPGHRVLAWDQASTLLSVLRLSGVSRRASLWNRTAPVAQVPAPLCSITTGWVAGQPYMFGAACNQSFLVFVGLWPGANRSGVLIGQSTPGWQDGFRTQALFQSELYVAFSNATGTLFVVDRWNCLVREVSIPAVGDYLTRAYTVYGRVDRFAVTGDSRCYGYLSLARPRSLFAGDGGPNARLFFLDEGGVWQLMPSTREVALAIPMAGTGSVWWVDAPDSVTVRVADGSGGRAFTAAGGPCPTDWTSWAGGRCTIRCEWRDAAGEYRNYVDPATGACTACTTPACEPGEQALPCEPRAPGRCQPCPPPPDGQVYSVPGSCSPSTLRLTPPCPSGQYQADPRFCAPCPPYTGTLLPGAVRVEQCKCWPGFERVAGRCSPGPMYSFPVNSACTPGPCALPPQAEVTDARTCAWACRAGYYRKTPAGFANACQPCGGAPAGAVFTTRGDADEPLSCEFRAAGA